MKGWRTASGVALFAAGLAQAGDSDVHRAMDFVFRDLYLREVSETGALGELAVGLVEREIRMRETQYRPRQTVRGVDVGALAGTLTAFCSMPPAWSGMRWERYGPRGKVLARAALTSKTAVGSLKTPAEWDEIARQNEHEPWLHLDLCLASGDIVRSQKLSTGQVHAAGTMLEELAKQGSLPATEGRYVAMDSLDVPDVKRWSPWLDGWERPILYKSDGHAFEVVSRGTDGVLGPQCRDEAERDDPDCDIVYEAGGGGRVPPGISGWFRK